MPTLTLKRSCQYYGALRSLKIEINQDLILLKNAEERPLDLGAGHYTLVARMDWATSKPLKIALLAEDHKVVFVDSGFLLLAVLYTFIPPFKVFTLKEIK